MITGIIARAKLNLKVELSKDFEISNLVGYESYSTVHRLFRVGTFLKNIKHKNPNMKLDIQWTIAKIMIAT